MRFGPSCINAKRTGGSFVAVRISLIVSILLLNRFSRAVNISSVIKMGEIYSLFLNCEFHNFNACFILIAMFVTLMFI